MKPGNKPDPEHLLQLAHYRMPYGKYKGRRLLDIPEAYYSWFGKKGFPEGKLGLMMQEMHQIKINGLEGLLRKLPGPDDGAVSSD